MEQESPECGDKKNRILEMKERERKEREEGKREEGKREEGKRGRKER